MISCCGNARHHLGAGSVMCCSTNLPQFAAHPFEIFQVWKGGMSFHGGFAGCVLAVVTFCPGARHPDAVARRRDVRGRADRHFLAGSPISSTASCGAARRRTVGDHISRRRAVAASPEPALRAFAEVCCCSSRSPSWSAPVR